MKKAAKNGPPWDQGRAWFSRAGPNLKRKASALRQLAMARMTHGGSKTPLGDSTFQALYSRLLESLDPIGEGLSCRDQRGLRCQNQARRDLNRPISMWVRGSV